MLYIQIPRPDEVAELVSLGCVKGSYYGQSSEWCTVVIQCHDICETSHRERQPKLGAAPSIGRSREPSLSNFDLESP